MSTTSFTSLKAAIVRLTTPRSVLDSTAALMQESSLDSWFKIIFANDINQYLHQDAVHTIIHYGRQVLLLSVGIEYVFERLDLASQVE